MTPPQTNIQGQAMKELNARNAALIALAASCFIQVGAQLFALTVVASTVAEAPPRSFAMFEGQYGYDSEAFWSTVPPITFALFVVALLANWKTQRRRLLLLALVMFTAAGLAAGLLVEPLFAEMIAKGYGNQVDPVLQSRAATWYRLDWLVWGLTAATGLVLLLALLRPVATAPKSEALTHG